MAQEFAYNVFLSHNSKDKSAVRALVERLRNDGVRVWFDDTSIAIGEYIGVALERGLQTSRHIVLIMSPLTPSISRRKSSGQFSSHVTSLGHTPSSRSSSKSCRMVL
jgi:hypothetical protein